MYLNHKVLCFAFLATMATSAWADETKLLAVLGSNAPLHEKTEACRELAHVATKQSIPTLSALLGDEKLSHMVRGVLETISDPAADEALRQALGTVHGRPRLGVIGSLGVRRDAQAIGPLAVLLHDGDAATVQAAARALGNIGTSSAAKALEAALPAATAANLASIGEGLLRAAEQLSAAGQRASSQAIYDRLRALSQAPSPVRAAALRGAILARGDGGIPLMREALHASDHALAAMAVRVSMELSGAAVTDALAAELAHAPADRQGILLVALADRGDPRVLPAVLRAAQSGDAGLRVLALHAVKRVGNASCAPALLDAAVGDNAEVAEAAMEALACLPGKAVDAELVARLTAAKSKARLVLIELAGRRRATTAAAALWRAADDQDPAVRAAAWAALGAVLDATELPKLIARLGAAKDPQELDALNKSLQTVAQRAANRDAAVAKLAANLPTAAQPLKQKILETLNVLGGARALAVVAAAARSEDAALRDAAFRVLGQWQTRDAATLLLDLHATAATPRLKAGAMRAYIRIARQFDMPADERAAMCRTALKTADRDEDKRLVLEVLLRYPTAESRAIALEATHNPALKDEALLVLMGMSHQRGMNRAELGRILAQAGHKPVKLEIIKAEFGAGATFRDVTAILRRHAGNYRVIFLPGATYNEALGGDPTPGIVKLLKIKYRINGREGETSLGENAPVVLPVPR
jgi:HEAT repeat protein